MADTAPNVSSTGPVGPGWLPWAAPAAGGLVALVGAGHLLAWLSGAMAGRGMATVTMKTNTALCFLLLGLALVLLAREAARAARRWSGLGCLGLAWVLGLLTLGENLAGWDLGIDQLLATELPGARGTLFPNRMGTPAAFCFTLCGPALALLVRGGRNALAWAQGLALAVCLVGLLTLMGHLYGIQRLYDVARLTTIAWPTTLCLLVLGLGLLLARPERGLAARVMARDAGGNVLRRLLPPVLLLPVALGWLRVAGERFGWYDAAMGTALVMLAVIVSLSTLTWQAARRANRAAAQLAEQKELLGVTLASIGDAVLTCDAQGRIGFINPTAAALTGWSPGEALGQPIHTVFPIVDEQTGLAIEDLLQRVLEQGCAVGLANHTALVTRQGLRVPIEDSAAPIRTADGRIAGMVLVFHDVTEKRRAHEALQEADRRKNEFLAMLSHELRNPLAPISNSLYLLDRVPPSSPQADQARQVIARQLAQLSSLVNDLLDITRITRGRIPLHPEPMDLREAVRWTLEDHRSLFQRAGVELELAPGTGPVPVLADWTRVVQVLGNLLHNAAKFSRRGGRTQVGVALEGEEAVVRVADDGMGMDPATLATLFQPFMQAAQSLDRGRGGLGLGLALVKGLVELQGGSVSAHSPGPGLGSLLVVRLPLAPAAPPRPAPAAVPAPAGGRRILLIEDNADVADSLREVLTLQGHQVTMAPDGPQGLALALAFDPEAVLCDIGLPGMSGFDVARAFQADPRLRGAFLIALSGYAQETDLRRAQEAGFQRHMAKPPDLDLLARILAELPCRSQANA